MKPNLKHREINNPQLTITNAGHLTCALQVTDNVILQYTTSRNLDRVISSV